MHDGNRCEAIKGWDGKAVIKGRGMVGVKDLLRRKMALNETRERGSLGWKIEMSSLTDRIVLSFRSIPLCIVALPYSLLYKYAVTAVDSSKQPRLRCRDLSTSYQLWPPSTRLFE